VHPPVNDVFLRGVEKVCTGRGIAFSKKDGHARCAAHVFNIALQEPLERIHAEHEEEYMASSLDISSVDCVQKLRRLIAKVCASPQRMEELANQCELSGVPKLGVLMDVRTCWNSTYKMLQRIGLAFLTAMRVLAWSRA
jgi:hypothetical protein